MQHIPLYLVNLFTLLTGFFIYFFYFINSSDAVAITFFLLAIYFTLLLLKKEKFSPKLAIALTISLFLCGFTKYLFIPVVFIIPAFLFLKGRADKNKVIKKTSVISFILLLVSLAGILAWQKISSGSAVYISEPARGFYPENLMAIHPAIPASFISRIRSV
jgi:4-amino-4-deoxy-L-arabinose transferase-like glycosyltransferase